MSRLCKIHLIVQFPFFEASRKNYGFFPNFKCFFKFILGAATYGPQEEFHLGRRNLRRPRRIPPWAPQLTAPKKNSTLGAATYGAQEEFCLGRRNLRRPRRILPWAPQLTAPKKNLEKNLKNGKNPKFFHDASKNRNCTIKCILHSLIYVLAYASSDPLKIWSWAYRPMTKPLLSGC